MRLIIDIPEENYKEMCEYGNERVDFDLKRMIQNGTVLPEKHGRLIDADALEELFREVISHLTKEQSIHIQGALEHMVRASGMTIEMITDAPTILEAWGNEE